MSRDTFAALSAAPPPSAARLYAIDAVSAFTAAATLAPFVTMIDKGAPARALLHCVVSRRPQSTRWGGCGSRHAGHEQVRDAQRVRRCDAQVHGAVPDRVREAALLPCRLRRICRDLHHGERERDRVRARGARHDRDKHVEAVVIIWDEHNARDREG